MNDLQSNHGKHKCPRFHLSVLKRAPFCGVTGHVSIYQQLRTSVVPVLKDLR
jgi:hypothetical protein